MVIFSGNILTVLRSFPYTSLCVVGCLGGMYSNTLDYWDGCLAQVTEFFLNQKVNTKSSIMPPIMVYVWLQLLGDDSLNILLEGIDIDSNEEKFEKEAN